MSLAVCPLPVERELREIHQCMRRELPGVDRVAAAVFDAATGTLRTFAHSTDGPAPFECYEAPLEGVPSLRRVIDSGVPRVIDDLAVLASSPSLHTRRLLEQGYRSSYTLPVYDAGRLMAILFLDSRRPGLFGDAQGWLSDFAHLAGLALCHRLATPLVLRATMCAAARLTHGRDPETRGHLERMSHHALAVARRLAPQEGLTDEWLEYLLLFAPLHDVGKIAIPDAILRKPQALDAEEMRVMRTHVEHGARIVDGILRDLRMDRLPHADMLRHVVRHHHEAVDGSGYPDGLAGDGIPLEARIVTVADVYDALTSRRPYKPAWPHAQALRYLEEHAGTRYDPACVLALGQAAAEIEHIAATFTDASDEHPTREGYDENW